jgi:hypothetical protein
MNTGQSLFSIGALLLLSLTVLRVNNNILYTDTVLYDSKFGIIANSIATSLVEKAHEKFYDANTAEGPVTLLTDLTWPLGPGVGESNPGNFNDFDDFNNYTQQDTFFNSLVFYTNCKVEYVNPSNPGGLDSKVNTQTWHKKMTVAVTWRQNDKQTSFAVDTIRQSSIYSYWYF